MGAESAFSHFEHDLKLYNGHKLELEESLDVIDKIYSDRWCQRFGWDETEPLNTIPHGQDWKFVNGALLRSIGRSTAWDVWAQSDQQHTHHVLTHNKRCVVCMPLRTSDPLLSLDDAILGSNILHAADDALRTLLQQSGILYTEDVRDTQNRIETCRQHIEKLPAREQTRAWKFLERLQVAQAFTFNSNTQLLFSLAAYNKFFVRTVYVYQGELNGSRCDWPFLRCTCYGTSVHNACEHIAYCREIPFPGMIESPLSRDILGAHQARPGRRTGTGIRKQRTKTVVSTNVRKKGMKTKKGHTTLTP